MTFWPEVLLLWAAHEMLEPAIVLGVYCATLLTIYSVGRRLAKGMKP